VTVPVDQRVAAGRAALRAGDPAGARRALEPALAEEQTADVLEALARVAYLERDYRRAIEGWEDAYAAHRAAGDHVGAVRVARTLAPAYGSILGDGAVMSGWLARAQTLLGEVGESPEAGWVALNRGLFEPDRAQKNRLFREALDIARRFEDTDLEFVTLAYLGASLVHADRRAEGMALLDEALAAVAGREVDDFCVLEEIFCQLFSACEYACDVARADQWIRIGEAIAERRRLPTVAAFCHTHYGGVLTAAGRWQEADAALTDAIRLWRLSERSPLGSGALVRLALLRVKQGRFDEAEQLLEGLDADSDADVAHARAAVHVAHGQVSLARDVLERALARLDEDTAAAAPLLALLVGVLLEADLVGEATDAVDRLDACAARHDRDDLRAEAALARGKVCLASGSGDPRACLRAALAGFSQARMPLEAAQARLELARSLVTNDPDVAEFEARAALDAFGRLEAARLADSAAAVLRGLGVRVATGGKGDGGLTRREVEVLDLLGQGLSNPEIATRLFISRKTVEHHVGNILSKLGLRSRAEAAAYATRSKPAVK